VFVEEGKARGGKRGGESTSVEKRGEERPCFHAKGEEYQYLRGRPRGGTADLLRAQERQKGVCDSGKKRGSVPKGKIATLTLKKEKEGGPPHGILIGKKGKERTKKGEKNIALSTKNPQLICTFTEGGKVLKKGEKSLASLRSKRGKKRICCPRIEEKEKNMGGRGRKV